MALEANSETRVIELRAFMGLTKVFAERNWKMPHYFTLNRETTGPDLLALLDIPQDQVEAIFVNRIPWPMTKAVIRPGDQFTPSTTELLKAAETRMAEDLAQTNSATTAAMDHTQQRQTMKQVLAGRDFRNLNEPTVKNALLEKLGNWLDKLFEDAAHLGVHAAWVGQFIVWGFILAVCLGLVWGLMQLEQRWRLRPAAESDSFSTGSVSAREWQLWIEDARKAAAAGQWREAIHFLYWAAISRLESRRLWPADRARTPREYLALVAPADPRRAGLATLTGSFERTWYGGRPAEERDYRRAAELAIALISGSGNAAIPVGTIQDERSVAQ